MTRVGRPPLLAVHRFEQIGRGGGGRNLSILLLHPQNKASISLTVWEHVRNSRRRYLQETYMQGEALPEMDNGICESRFPRASHVVRGSGYSCVIEKQRNFQRVPGQC